MDGFLDISVRLRWLSIMLNSKNILLLYTVPICQPPLSFNA